MVGALPNGTRVSLANSQLRINWALDEKLVSVEHMEPIRQII